MLKNQIIQGDCLEVMPDIPDGSIDAVICDPPYGTTACSWDSVIPFEPMWEQLNRVIKKNGAIVLFGSEPFSSALRMSNIKNYKYDWVWDKVFKTGHLNARKKPMMRHEIIMVFCKQTLGNFTYNPQTTKGKLRDKSPPRNTDMVSGGVYGLVRNQKSNINNNMYPSSICVFSTAQQKGKVHPTQKPVSLIKYLIKTYTNKHETVLDFAAGSCTTAAACINTHRNYICIEKEQKYVDIGNKRILTAEPSLF